MSTQLNNIKVKPIPLPKVRPESVLGHQLFSEPYGNIFIVAKKKSGKTCVINSILKHCVNKSTVVYIFCSTAYKDVSYKYIVQKLRKKQIIVHVFTEIEPLQKVLNELNNINMDSYFDESDSESDEELTQEELLFGSKPKPKKPTKPKIIAPENVFLFDDLSKQLQSPVLSALMKANRHYKSKVIISSQYPNDLALDARKQVDYWILFGGHSKDKLQVIYDNADLNINFNKFLLDYKTVTATKYNFLYINTINSQLRKNFNELIN